MLPNVDQRVVQDPKRQHDGHIRRSQHHDNKGKEEPESGRTIQPRIKRSLGKNTVKTNKRSVIGSAANHSFTIYSRGGAIYRERTSAPKTAPVALL